MLSRRFITALGVLGLPSVYAFAQTESVTGLWSDHLAATRTEALAFIRDHPSEISTYLHLITARLIARRDIPSSQLATVPWANPGIEFGSSNPAPPFAIVEFRLAPGTMLPPHNHPHTSVATIMLEGHATVDNFELEQGSAPPGVTGAALLRHTHRSVLRPRDVNMVMPSRNNLHALKAGPHGARGIDLTTQHQTDGAFGFLRVLDPANIGGVLRAEWVDPTTQQITWD